jgi:choline transport protein
MANDINLEKRSGDSPDGGSVDETIAAVEDGAVVNASGYKDQLKRQYSLVGLAGIALTIDNAWVALGSSISVSISESYSHVHHATPTGYHLR